MFQDLALGAAIAALAGLILCRAQLGTGPIDTPDSARKSHGTPTPTSGGVGIAAGFAIALIVLSLFTKHWREEISQDGTLLMTVTSSFAYLFLFVGFVDDNRPLGPRLKFALFVLASAAASLSIGVVRALPLGNGVELDLGLYLGLIGTAAWVFTLVNCVNFMDGSNGLAMGSVAVGLCALAIIALMRGAPGGAAIGICGAGALMGFLVWNLPSGRLFAGDSGALFAGALAALTSLLVIASTGLSPFVPPILFFPLLADVLLTLAWRARRGRSLFDGHSEHIYQIALRAGWSHPAIAFAYWLAMAVCGAIGVWAAQRGETVAPWSALAALALAAIAISAFVRRIAVKRGIAEI